MTIIGITVTGMPTTAWTADPGQCSTAISSGESPTRMTECEQQCQQRFNLVSTSAQPIHSSREKMGNAMAAIDSGRTG